MYILCVNFVAGVAYNSLVLDNKIWGFWMRSFLFFLEFLFIVCERENASAWAEEGQRERERENPKQALQGQHRAGREAWTQEPWDHDLSWNQESDT